MSWFYSISSFRVLPCLAFKYILCLGSTREEVIAMIHRADLNTSYVLVLQQIYAEKGQGKLNLNTSYVLVLLLSFQLYHLT